MKAFHAIKYTIQRRDTFAFTRPTLGVDHLLSGLMPVFTRSAAVTSQIHSYESSSHSHPPMSFAARCVHFVPFRPVLKCVVHDTGTINLRLRGSVSRADLPLFRVWFVVPPSSGIRARQSRSGADAD